MRKIASLCAVLMMLCTLAFAQQRTVTGTVTDATGAAVPFASIKEVGTKNGVSADANGNFSIKIATNSKLEISASGFTAQIITPEADNQISVTMQRAGGSLQEVVVTTALGIKRNPKEIGYSTATVNAQQIASSKSFNLGQALTNKVSGLVVYNTSASVNATPRVILRGIRSLTGDNTALIVLDGVAVPSNTLNYINPNDVESVSVMKGGQAATLFGSDGVNGAIVITTKKGSKRPEISITHTFNVEQLAYLPKFQNEFGSGSGYGANKAENYHPAENQQYGPAFDGSIRHPGRVLQDGSYLSLPYSAIPGIREKIWDKGQTNQTDLSYRAGDENSNIYSSYQHLNTNGIVPGDKYERNSLRLNASRTYKKFRLSFDATYTWDKSDRTNTDFYFLSLNAAAWIPLTDFKDWKNNKFADPSGYYNDYYNNPWWSLDNNRFGTRNTYFNGNITGNYKINNDLDLTARLGIANTQTQTTTTANPYYYNGWASSTSGAYLTGYTRDYDYFLTGGGYNKARSPIPGSIGESYNWGNRINADIYASYNKKFGDVSLKATVGDNIQVRKGKSIGVSTAALLNADFFNLTNSATGLYSGSNSITEQSKTGIYADVTGGYRNLVFLHGTVRNDWTSVFYLEGRDPNLYSYTTYGADLSFSLLDIFNYHSNTFSYAKLRGGYNLNRNDNVGPYSLQQVYLNASGYPYSGLIGNTISGTSPDPGLNAERVASTEIGLDLAFLKNRISLEATYYNQVSDKQILNVSVAPSSGIQSVLINAAKVVNNGYEVELKTNLVHNRDWDVNVNFQYSHNENEVKQLYVGGLNTVAYQSDNLKTLNAEIGQMFPYLKTTYWQRDSLGRVIIDPTTGWPTKAAATRGIGNTMPKNIFGINLNVAYKHFTLSANAEYRGDYVIYNDLGEDMSFTGTGALTTLYHREQFLWPNSSYDDGSGKYVPNTNIATSQFYAGYYGPGDLSNGDGLVNTGEPYWSSGDFWKLREVNLTYDFDVTKWGTISKTIKGVSLTAWGRNLKTWLAKDNWFTDPEFSNTNGNSIGINTTANTPPTRQFGGTIKVVF